MHISALYTHCVYPKPLPYKNEMMRNRLSSFKQDWGLFTAKLTKNAIRPICTATPC